MIRDATKDWLDHLMKWLAFIALLVWVFTGGRIIYVGLDPQAARQALFATQVQPRP